MRVERRQRLVQEEQRRIARESARQGDPLPLAARELRDPRTSQLRDPEALEQRLHIGVAPCAEAHVVPHVEVREERVLLEEVADTPSLGRHVDATRRVEEHRVVQRDDAFVGAQQAGDDPQYRRLPRSRRPDERDRLAVARPSGRPTR